MGVDEVSLWTAVRLSLDFESMSQVEFDQVQTVTNKHEKYVNFEINMI